MFIRKLLSVLIGSSLLASSAQGVSPLVSVQPTPLPTPYVVGSQALVGRLFSQRVAPLPNPVRLQVVRDATSLYRFLSPVPILIGDRLKRGFEGPSQTFPDHPDYPKILEQLQDGVLFRHLTAPQFFDVQAFLVRHQVPLRIMKLQDFSRDHVNLYRDPTSPSFLVGASQESIDVHFRRYKMILENEIYSLAGSGTDEDQMRAVFVSFVSAIRQLRVDPFPILKALVSLAFEVRPHAFEEESFLRVTSQQRIEATIVLDPLTLTNPVRLRGAVLEAAGWLVEEWNQLKSPYRDRKEQADITTITWLALIRTVSMNSFMQIYGELLVDEDLTLREFLEGLSFLGDTLDDQRIQAQADYVDLPAFKSGIRLAVEGLLEYLDQAFPGIRWTPSGIRRKLHPGRIPAAA